MELFLLLEIGIELGESLEGELVGQPYELRVWHVLLLEVTNLHWVGGAEHEKLLLWLHKVNNLFNDVFEVV